MTLNKYQTFIFDCDGVILNSNKIKSDAFHKVALVCGERAAEELLAYHVRNGGISRYEKFSYFIEVIVPKYSSKVNIPTMEELLQSYATQVKRSLLTCEIAQGLYQLRKEFPNTTWCVVSGGDQEELRDIFKARKIDNLFDGGVFGSPDNKYSIMNREIEKGNIVGPAILFGDSRLDHEVAESFDVDFIFLNKWTEFKEWEAYCSYNHIHTLKEINCLLENFLTI